MAEIERINYETNNDLLKVIKEGFENGTLKLQVTDAGGDVMTVNHEGRGDVVQHAHPNSTTVFFSSGDISESKDFIVVDISDTVNYHHVLTNYVHPEDYIFQIDASSNAQYTILLGFLENVDATNGDFYVIGGIAGSKAAGQSKFESIGIYPNGTQCTTSLVTTSIKSLNDTAFQTDTNLPSTLNPATNNTPSGNGDLVMRVIVTAGSLNVAASLPYHTH